MHHATYMRHSMRSRQRRLDRSAPTPTRIVVPSVRPVHGDIQECTIIGASHTHTHFAVGPETHTHTHRHWGRRSSLHGPGRLPNPSD